MSGHLNLTVQNTVQLSEAIGRLNLLSPGDLLAYDIETDGLVPVKNQIIGVSVYSPKCGGIYIVHKAWENGKLVEKVSKQELRQFCLNLSQYQLITHNGSFDLRFTSRYCDVDLTGALYCDTMLLAHTCDENKMNYGLKELAAKYLRADAADSQKEMLASIKSNGGTEKQYFKADPALLAKYAIEDVKLTHELFLHFSRELANQQLEKFFYEDEVMPLYKHVTIPMELQGIPVDLPLLESTYESIKKDLATLETSIQAAIEPNLTQFYEWYIAKKYPYKLNERFKDALGKRIAPPNWPVTKAGGYSLSKVELEKAVKKKGLDLNCDFYKITSNQMHPPKSLISEIQLELLKEDTPGYVFNISSKDHLKRLFFTALGCTPVSKTELGNPQVDDDFLESVKGQLSWVADLQVFNSLTKIKGTYIERFLNAQVDGMFYPSFFQHRTVSGRYGSDFQQLSRPLQPGEAPELVVHYTNLIRRFFISGPGYKFVDDDYESLEPHLFANESGDPGLIGIFKRGDDFYSTIAIDTEGLQGLSANKKAENYLGKLNKSARQKSKAYSLGIPYGMSGYKLHFEIGVSEAEADRLVKKYLAAYPKLKEWMQTSEKHAQAHSEIRTKSGRVRRFPLMKWTLSKDRPEELTNGLDLWKKYKYNYKGYKKAKKRASYFKNYMNNCKNVQIQGLGASVINRASIALAKELKRLNMRSYICASIHDELVLRCPDSEVAAVAKLTQFCMERKHGFKLSLDLKAVPSVGLNLAEAKGA